MSEENKLPTASQSLYKWNFKLVHEDMAKCIDEHTRLHTDHLREELEKLRAWKESAMKTLGVVDLQECGKLLNIGLGQSIADKIVPGIKELRAENERLKNIISGYESSLKDYDVERKHLIDEQEKLREALVKIANSDSSGPDTDGLIEIAKEALKGGSDE